MGGYGNEKITEDGILEPVGYSKFDYSYNISPSQPIDIY